MTEKNSPFDDLRELIGQLGLTGGKIGTSKEGFCDDTLGELGVSQFPYWLRVCQGKSVPELGEVHICVLASSYSEDTKNLALSFIEEASKGKATVNALCKDKGIGLRVLEMAPSVPHDTSANWAEKDCMAAVAFGMEAAAAGGDLLGLSDFAPGSSAPAIKIIEKLNIFLEHESKDNIEEIRLTEDPLSVLREYGGREIAGMVGALIAARIRDLPVFIEGWSALAALHILAAMDFTVTRHVQVASYADEQQKQAALALGKTPVIGQSVEMGQGCGIALAVSAMAPLMQIPLS